MKHASLQKCIAVVLALAVWQGAAMAVGMDLLLSLIHISEPTRP